MSENSRYFVVELTPPMLGTGYLKLGFKHPWINFAWSTGLYSANELTKMTIKDAKMSFLRMIETELDAAFKQAEERLKYEQR